MEIAIYDWR